MMRQRGADFPVRCDVDEATGGGDGVVVIVIVFVVVKSSTRDVIAFRTAFMSKSPI